MIISCYTADLLAVDSQTYISSLIEMPLHILYDMNHFAHPYLRLLSNCISDRFGGKKTQQPKKHEQIMESLNAYAIMMLLWRVFSSCVFSPPWPLLNNQLVLPVTMCCVCTVLLLHTMVARI